jgi:hypothetical protein
MGEWSSECLDLSGASLFALQKERSLRRFKTRNGEMVEVVARNERITSGCNFEMTILTSSDGSRWWTLGFEAFGELNEIENLLAAWRSAIPPTYLMGYRTVLRPGLRTGVKARQVARGRAVRASRVFSRPGPDWAKVGLDSAVIYGAWPRA